MYSTRFLEKKIWNLSKNLFSKKIFKISHLINSLTSFMIYHIRIVSYFNHTVKKIEKVFRNINIFQYTYHIFQHQILSKIRPKKSSKTTTNTSKNPEHHETTTTSPSIHISYGKRWENVTQSSYSFCNGLTPATRYRTHTHTQNRFPVYSK